MYLDSCIIIKLLVPERDSDFFQAQLQRQYLSTSELAWTEVASALLAKERAGILTPAKRQAAWQVFVNRVNAKEITLEPLDATTLRKASHVLQTCHPHVPLRTLDAIHTAACDLSQDFPLCSTDRRMREAARHLQIPVFPVEEPA